MFDSWSGPTIYPDSTTGRSLETANFGSGLASRNSSRSKRAFDIVVAAAILLAMLPALLIIAAIVAADSPGPIIFRQRRTGLNGKVFTILKFRTMSVTEDGTSIAHAKKNDHRTTRVGKFLRESSLDEIPQLINVLGGDMSLVGPRPHALAHDAYYGSLIPTYNDRFAVRPGLTGLAQSRGLRGEIRGLDCMARRVDSDLQYARTWSLLGDLKIILETIPALLKRQNAC